MGDSAVLELAQCFPDTDRSLLERIYDFNNRDVGMTKSALSKMLRRASNAPTPEPASEPRDSLDLLKRLETFRRSSLAALPATDATATPLLPPALISSEGLSSLDMMAAGRVGVQLSAADLGLDPRVQGYSPGADAAHILTCLHRLLVSPLAHSVSLDVPWNDTRLILALTELPALLAAEGDAAPPIDPGMLSSRLFLSLSFCRRDGSFHELPLPSDPTQFAPICFSLPSIRNHFLHCVRVLASIRPARLLLGTCVNALFKVQETQLGHFGPLYFEASIQAKHYSPRSRVSLNLSYEHLHRNANQYTEVLHAAGDKLDFLSITSVPSDFVANVAEIPADYYHMLANLASSEDDMVLNIGWSSDNDASSHFPARPDATAQDGFEEQVAFIYALPRLLSEACPNYTMWYGLHDQLPEQSGLGLFVTPPAVAQQPSTPGLGELQLLNARHAKPIYHLWVLVRVSNDRRLDALEATTGAAAESPQLAPLSLVAAAAAAAAPVPGAIPSPPPPSVAVADPPVASLPPKLSGPPPADSQSLSEQQAQQFRLMQAGLAGPAATGPGLPQVPLPPPASPMPPKPGAMAAPLSPSIPSPLAPSSLPDMDLLRERIQAQYLTRQRAAEQHAAESASVPAQPQVPAQLHALPPPAQQHSFPPPQHLQQHQQQQQQQQHHHHHHHQHHHHLHQHQHQHQQQVPLPPAHMMLAPPPPPVAAGAGAAPPPAKLSPPATPPMISVTSTPMVTTTPSTILPLPPGLVPSSAPLTPSARHIQQPVALNEVEGWLIARISASIRGSLDLTPNSKNILQYDHHLSGLTGTGSGRLWQMLSETGMPDIICATITYQVTQHILRSGCLRGGLPLNGVELFEAADIARVTQPLIFPVAELILGHQPTMDRLRRRVMIDKMVKNDSLSGPPNTTSRSHRDPAARGVDGTRIFHEIAEDQGPRASMEDRLIALPYVNELFGLSLPQRLSFYAVLDGHGGRRVADYATELLPVHIFRSPVLGESLEQAIRGGIHSTNENWKGKVARESMVVPPKAVNSLRGAGATLAAALVVDSAEVIVAWVGDSQVALFSPYQCPATVAAPAGLLEDPLPAYTPHIEPLQVVAPHRASDPAEQDAVVARGGFVSMVGETARVNGILAVPRAIGDVQLHSVITCDPTIRTVRLGASPFRGGAGAGSADGGASGSPASPAPAAAAAGATTSTTPPGTMAGSSSSSAAAAGAGATSRHHHPSLVLTPQHPLLGGHSPMDDAGDGVLSPDTPRAPGAGPEPENRILVVLACDGLFDTLTPAECAPLIGDHLGRNFGSAQGLAVALTRFARASGSTDNVSVQVLEFS